VVLCELRKVLIDIKYYRDRDNKQYRIDVCSNEFANDIPVNALNISEWIQYMQEMQLVCQPFAYSLQKSGVITNPSCHFLDGLCVFAHPAFHMIELAVLS
jgi:hypothetical protein